MRITAHHNVARKEIVGTQYTPSVNNAFPDGFVVFVGDEGNDNT
jgi:hypothetical protein